MVKIFFFAILTTCKPFITFFCIWNGVLHHEKYHYECAFAIQAVWEDIMPFNFVIVVGLKSA